MIGMKEYLETEIKGDIERLEEKFQEISRILIGATSQEEALDEKTHRMVMKAKDLIWSLEVNDLERLSIRFSQYSALEPEVKKTKRINLELTKELSDLREELYKTYEPVKSFADIAEIKLHTTDTYSYHIELRFDPFMFEKKFEVNKYFKRYLRQKVLPEIGKKLIDIFTHKVGLKCEKRELDEEPMAKIFAVEISAPSFPMHVKESDLERVVRHIWEHPSRYHDVGRDDSTRAYYSFLKYLWIEYQDGSEVRLAEIVKF
jgi:hypothetical protein